MARKLNSAERQVFEEALKQAETGSIEVPPDHFLRRLKEQQQPSMAVGQLALWLSEDPLSQR